jgi:nucleoid-associated protein YgaU
MALAEKYADLVSLGQKLGIKTFEAKEEGGKLQLKGTSTYQLEKDLLWDKIKTYSGWEGEVAADIRVEKTDIHGVHTVVSGDTLSKIAKVHLDNANRYMEIFNLNKDILSDPNKIQVGQQLKIPPR